MRDTPSLRDAWSSIQSRFSRHRYQLLDGQYSQSFEQTKDKRHWRASGYAILASVALAVIIWLFHGRRAQRPQEEVQVELQLEASAGPYVAYHHGQYWHGWPSIKHMVVFGDSWSTTTYKHEEAWPSPENPLGNPDFPGETSTNGANWVDYLTYTYNESQILTANFAVGGATVDEQLLVDTMPHADGLHGFRNQAHTFAEQYVNTSRYDWKADSALFFIWFGINDVHFSDNETVHLLPTAISRYAEYTDLLYQCGARNFVFLTVPPVDRAPIAASRPEHYSRYTAEFNHDITELVSNFTKTYEDATTFLFDAHRFLDDVIDDPCVDPVSCGIQETEGMCLMYSFGTIFHDPDCPYDVNEYFWMNPLHPTSVAHNATAHALVQALKASGGEEERKDG